MHQFRNTKKMSKNNKNTLIFANNFFYTYLHYEEQ